MKNEAKNSSNYNQVFAAESIHLHTDLKRFISVGKVNLHLTNILLFLDVINFLNIALFYFAYFNILCMILSS